MDLATPLAACTGGSAAEPIAAIVLALAFIGALFQGDRIAAWGDRLVRAAADRLRGGPDTGARP